MLQMLGDDATDLKAGTSGRNEYGNGVDVWAAGVLAYELMLGGPPFEADTKAQTYARILAEDPFLPSMWSKDATNFLKQVGFTPCCLAHQCLQSSQKAQAFLCFIATAWPAHLWFHKVEFSAASKNPQARPFESDL